MTNTSTGAHRTTLVNGLRLNYLEWGDASAPPLVCVHGFRSNAHAFDGLAEHFCDRFHVIALDVRGRGDSEWAKDGDYSMAAYVSDLEGVVEALGLAQFSLIGTSMGGRIAMHYAERNADRLRCLVLNDIGPESEAGSDRITGEAASTPSSFESLQDAIAYRAQTNAAAAKLPVERQQAVALTLFREDADSGRWLWKNDPEFLRQRAEKGAESYPHLWDVLRDLECPTLLVWGTASDVLSREQAKRIIEALPHGELAEVPGAPHAPALTEAESIAALERLLTSSLASPSSAT